MKSVVKPDHAAAGHVRQRGRSIRAVLIGGTALVVVVIAGIECAALRQPAHDDTALGREASSQRAPSPTARAAAQAPLPRPALPPVNAVEPPPALPHAKPVESSPRERPSIESITGEEQRTRTHIKVDRYVSEAYPAWLRAHPGQECPHRLSELNEYIHESDANDAWGRPLTMYCGADRLADGKRIQVSSLGRDAEARTEDDIIAED